MVPLRVVDEKVGGGEEAAEEEPGAEIAARSGMARISSGSSSGP